MNFIEKWLYDNLKQFERRKFVRDGIEYICMKRHDTLLSATLFNGTYQFQLHTKFTTCTHINRPRDRQSREMLEELGWVKP